MSLRDGYPHGVPCWINLSVDDPATAVAFYGDLLGWDLADQEPAARACLALMSDWFPATTGEIVHADGGFHAIGA